MKVLQVNCVYRKGSTGKIVADLHEALLARGVESVVCYGRGETVREPHVHKVCGEWYAKWNHLRARITGVMYGGCFFSTNRLMGIIKREKPDVVHLQCINGYFVNVYRLVSWLKRRGILTVLTLHAEFMFTANCGHALDCDRWKTGCGCCPRLRKETETLLWDRTAWSHRKMKQAFDGMGDTLTVLSVSPWLRERAMQSPILGGKSHRVVMNGLDTAVFCPGEDNGLKEAYGLADKRMVFHATAAFSDDPTHFKGGHYLLKLAEQWKDEPIQIVVAAGETALSETLPPNVTLLGRVEDPERLAAWYRAADVTVITSRRETFSMVCAESLCCGTPVVGFAAGGPETIALPAYSQFVEQGDVEGLRRGIEQMMLAAHDPVAVSAAAQAVYGRHRLAEETLAAYRDLMKGNAPCL